MRPTSHALAFIAVIPAFVLLWAGGACSSSNDASHDSGTDSAPLGSGGQKATGGAAGSGIGGDVGSGGRATGGAGGGVVGSGGGPSVGGSPGSGGTPRIDGGVGTGGLPGTGGRATGGATGGGGTLAMDASRSDGAGDHGMLDMQGSSDAAAEVGRDGAGDTAADAGDTAADAGDAAADAGDVEGPADAPVGGDGDLADLGSSSTLESCFAGLPAQIGIQMIASKSTADGRVRMRIALDTEDRSGTSGTLAWGLIRLAVEVDGVVACLTDRSALRYTLSHHNCSDTATGKAGTTTYALSAPDRATATLTIEGNGSSTGPYTLTDTACTMLWSAGAPITCRSGGPC